MRKGNNVILLLNSCKRVSAVHCYVLCEWYLWFELNVTLIFISFNLASLCLANGTWWLIGWILFSLILWVTTILRNLHIPIGTLNLVSSIQEKYLFSQMKNHYRLLVQAFFHFASTFHLYFSGELNESGTGLQTTIHYL